MVDSKKRQTSVRKGPARAGASGGSSRSFPPSTHHSEASAQCMPRSQAGARAPGRCLRRCDAMLGNQWTRTNMGRTTPTAPWKRLRKAWQSDSAVGGGRGSAYTWLAGPARWIGINKLDWVGLIGLGGRTRERCLGGAPGAAGCGNEAAVQARPVAAASATRRPLTPHYTMPRHGTPRHGTPTPHPTPHAHPGWSGPPASCAGGAGAPPSARASSAERHTRSSCVPPWPQRAAG